VAIDLGESSEKVLRWAACFANNAGADLTVLHVTPTIEGMSGEYFEPNWKDRFAEEAQHRIVDLQAEVGSQAAVALDAGPVPEKVANLATAAGADILVIGRGSTSGVFGRIRAHSYGIIRQSACPVVSV
jgi:nucleotide-binding universal stress UspA family protein